MNAIKIIVFLVMLFSCTSKMKEGAGLTVYNRNGYDIFVIDRFTLGNTDNNKPLEVLNKSFVNLNTKKLENYLKDELITMYTNKRIFFSIKNYNNNKIYDYLTFYIVKRRDLIKTKQVILEHKLYDSINVEFNKFEEKGINNHLYIEGNRISFKNE